VIYYRNDLRGSGVDRRALLAATQRLLHEIGEDRSSLSVTLVGDTAIRSINRAHRGKDAATDVLSFPLDGLASPQPAEDAPERMLGDVVISVETARRQADDYDAPLQDELYRLLIHGLLHVVGHDHVRAVDRRKMEREERRLAGAIGLRWPYENHH
jgi:probable rRNA maturation factor